MRVSFWTIASVVMLRMMMVAAAGSPPTPPPPNNAAASLNLLPMPKSVTLDQGDPLIVGRGFEILIGGHNDERLQHAAHRLAHAIRAVGSITQQASGVPRKTFGVLLRCDGVDGDVQSVDEDESYALTITSKGVLVRASTPVGVLRGIQTFLQLLHKNNGYIEVPACHIVDAPRFRWRGLLVDCSRHFEPVDVLERNLDYMERAKLNVFHWHLSDDQGFRAESKVFPDLTGKGSDGQFYTQDQIKEVIAYARDRGIRVVPEFDMPGHSTSWFVGYPDLASGPGPYSLQRRWGVFDPAMDPTKESTYVFLDKFIGEMAALFPDHWFHIGGDEVNGHQWDQNPDIQAFMKAHGMTSNADLQAYFNSRVHDILTKYHKQMIGWDEVLRPGVSPDIAIQSWRGQRSLAEAARTGHLCILSSGYYLDSLRPASTYYANDPDTGATANLTDADRAHILGGEACMWGEQIDEKSIMGRIWPRAAAIAERLWSPQSTTDVDSLAARIAQFDPRTITAEAPFHGTPAEIPGTLQAADFDIGGEGVSYHSNLDYNAGGWYRPGDNVCIGDTDDAGSSHDLEYIAAGDWLKYTVNVKEAGSFDVRVGVASDGDGGTFHLEDATGNRLGPAFSATNTGGWHTWKTIDGVVTLPAGVQTLTLVEDTSGYNLSSVEFVKTPN